MATEYKDYRKLNIRDVDAFVTAAAGDHVEAGEYLRQMLQVMEAMDDILDGDASKMADEGKQRMFWNLLTGFSQNPFFLKNYPGLSAVHMVTFNAWMGSDEVKAMGDSREIAMYGRALSDFYTEIFCYVGFLTGGYDRMRRVSSMLRKYYIHKGFDDLGE